MKASPPPPHPAGPSSRPLTLAALCAALLLAPAGTAVVAGPASGGPGAVSQAASSAPRSVGYAGRAMGTQVRVTLVSADSSADAPRARAALGVFTRLDSLLSNWTTTSEVARLNREAAAGPTLVQEDAARVLQAALRVGRESAGAFDITVEPLVRAWGFLGGRPRVPAPAEAEAAFARVGLHQVEYDPAARTLRFAREGVRIDLGGIAKGYAVDRAAEALAALGVRDALVDISGNMAALGAPAGAPHWRIGIRDPRDRMPYFARLRLDRPGISTSGKYEQFVAADGRTYGHIIDPRSGRPAEGLISVTVLAPSAMEADAWSTALFVLGPAEARRVAGERAELEAILVSPGAAGVDTVWVERGLAGRFQLETGAGGVFHVELF